MILVINFGCSFFGWDYLGVEGFGNVCEKPERFTGVNTTAEAWP